MNQIQLFNFFFSKDKWRKVAYIFGDHAKTITQRLLQNSDSLPSLNSANSEESIGFKQTSYSASITISEKITTVGKIESKSQDKISGNKISTEFHYVSSNIPNAFMYTDGARHQSVFDEHRNRVEEYSYGKLPHFSKNRLMYPAGESIDGLSLNLCGTLAISGGNYAHWLIDGYSMLAMILDRYDISSFDHVVVPTLKHDFHTDSLLNIGITADKIIEIMPLDCLQFANLVCASPPRDKSSSVVPGWVIDFYQEYASKVTNANAYPKRVYISRKDAPGRNIRNESSLVAMLKQYGFENIELSQYRYDEKISIFKNAEIVVGLSGAGLTNLMFARSDLKVIEIMPKTSANYLYASISAYLDIQHEVLLFEKNTALKELNAYYGSFEIDQSELEALVVDAIST